MCYAYGLQGLCRQHEVAGHRYASITRYHEITAGFTITKVLARLREQLTIESQLLIGEACLRAFH